jgi:hypothetical protein
MLEEIARTSLTRISINPELLDFFIDNETIMEFWLLQDYEREKIEEFFP